MPYSLFCMWMEYHRLEPFGSQFDNWLMAVPTQMFHQVHSKSPLKIKDLMYKDVDIKRKEDTENLIQFLDAFEPKGK